MKRIFALFLFILAASLLLASGGELEATAPGVNGRIAFTRHYEDVYLVNPDGSGEVQLTTDPASDQNPRWCSDGQRIAFLSFRSGNADVWVMNADGSGKTNLTINPAYDQNPTWSPDCSKIAFMSNRSGNDDIWLMNSDGTGAINLTNHPADDYGSDWSPDGTEIAFVSDRNVGEQFTDIYKMNAADGSGQTLLCCGPSTHESHPSWSPDSAKIVFNGEVSSPGGNTEVFTMNSDGSGKTNISNHGAFDAHPDWSPDGNLIVFATQRDGFSNLYTMNPDGSNQSPLLVNGAHDLDPDWGSPPQPVGVGGMVELRTDSDAPAAASRGSADSKTLMMTLAAGAILALTAGGWYARRRWLG